MKQRRKRKVRLKKVRSSRPLPTAPLKEVQEATEKVIEQYAGTLRRLGKE